MKPDPGLFTGHMSLELDLVGLTDQNRQDQSVQQKNTVQEKLSPVINLIYTLVDIHFKG